jgi:hypothetical protein
MTRFARSATQLVVTAVLATALSFAVPVFIDSHEYAHAVLNYTKNPGPDTEARFRIESKKNQRLTIIVLLASVGVLFILMNCGWWLVKRRSRLESIGSPGR